MDSFGDSRSPSYASIEHSTDPFTGNTPVTEPRQAAMNGFHVSACVDGYRESSYHRKSFPSVFGRKEGTVTGPNDASFTDTLLNNGLGIIVIVGIFFLAWSAIDDALNRREERDQRLTRKKLPIAPLTWSERFPRKR